MLTDNEKKLLYLLAVLLVVCSTALFFYLRITWEETGLNDLNRSIREIENSVRNLQITEDENEDLMSEIENIEEQIENEQSRFYLPGETDIANFGLQVKDLIVSNRLRITNQRTITQQDKNYIEFSCEGKANNLALFLKGVSDAEKYWRIDSLSIQSRTIDGNITAKMRITYETITTDNN
jgi:Tfp pilus assembly protein PilO